MIVKIVAVVFGFLLEPGELESANIISVSAAQLRDLNERFHAVAMGLIGLP